MLEKEVFSGKFNDFRGFAGLHQYAFPIGKLGLEDAGTKETQDTETSKKAKRGRRGNTRRATRRRTKRNLPGANTRG